MLLNPNVAPLLSRRMADKDGLPFRDGYASSPLCCSLTFVSLYMLVFLPLLLLFPFLSNLYLGWTTQEISWQCAPPLKTSHQRFGTLPSTSSGLARSSLSLTLVSLLLPLYSPHLSLTRERKERGEADARGVQNGSVGDERGEHAAGELDSAEARHCFVCKGILLW